MMRDLRVTKDPDSPGSGSSDGDDNGQEGGEHRSPGAGNHDAKNGKITGDERKPLKTILQNFLNHVETLESQKGEEDCTYEKEFQRLKAFSDSLKTKTEFACKEGELEVNRKKNRYKDILPFDYTRVLLSEYPGVPGSDYINANYIKGASGSNAYIASQGPLPHTVNDFWRMVVEAEVQVIVMACNETEAGKHKCERYWCDSDNEANATGSASSSSKEESGGKKSLEEKEAQFGKFFVKVLKMRDICPDFSVRTMRLRWTSEDGKKDEERTICQFHYSAWPDHGIPTQVKPLLEMVRLIRDCQASETLPVLVHCSAGCGRTGTICAIDFIWGLLRTGKLKSDFSLFELVKDMRRQRIAMVQTVDQYILVHRAVRELFLEQLRVIDSHPYENVDGDGHPLGRNGDEVFPDYETIFVENNNRQQSENDFDKILNQRMSQPRTVMGTAMLSRESKALSKSDDHILSSPPQPPPKQRDALIDASAIDERKIKYDSFGDLSAELRPIESFTQKSEPILFEPAKPPHSSKDGAAQRFKKGNLRLAKSDNGSWRLEELGGDTKAEKKNETKKKKKGKENEENSKSSELLRRPSIKKLKAFFNKDKEGVKEPVPVVDSSEDSPQSDTEISSALAKMPKLGVTNDLSKSVPGSLDRKSKQRDPDYANVDSRSSVDYDNEKSNSWNNEDKSKLDQIARTLSTSRSSDRLISLGRSSNNRYDSRKPTLPVKRSKSMKVITTDSPIVIKRERSPLYANQSSSGKPGFKKSPSTSEFRSLPFEASSHSRQGSLEEKQLSRKNSYDYANAVQPNRIADYIDSPRKLETSGFLKSYPPDYVNVRTTNQTDEHQQRTNIIEQQLMQLHHRINSNKKDPTIPEDLRKSLPLIARSSDSLDSEARRMLKDCQKYLMASFTNSGIEGERLIRKNPIKNYHSAESSPMTTLQKSNAHLFSSHSSPSNSYNKYSNGNNGGKVSSPPGTIQKSVSSPTGTIQKNFCSPAATAAVKTDSSSNSTSIFQKNTLPVGESSRAFPSSSSQQQLYANVVGPKREAQRKVSESSNLLNSKERRNSFREAVENKGYESIWFEKERHFVEGTSLSNRLNSKRTSRTEGGDEEVLVVTREPSYANTTSDVVPKYPSPPQRAEPQQKQSLPPRRSWERSPPVPKIALGNYENISALESGYEPVNFKDGPSRLIRASESPSKPSYQQLQSVSLVSEVLKKSETPMAKQNSSTSLTSKHPPPPYKEPPQPIMRTSSQPFFNLNNNILTQHGNRREPETYLRHSYHVNPPAQFSNQNSAPSSNHQSPPSLPVKENPSNSSYVNVHVTRRHSRDSDYLSKDDSVINRRAGGKKALNRRSTSQAVANRLSLGDISAFNRPSQQSFSIPNNNNTKPNSKHGVPMKKSSPQSYMRISGGGEGPMSPDNNLSASPPGIDIDQLAASMANNHKKDFHTGNKPVVTAGRSFAGVFSGAAANIKSKLSGHISGNMSGPAISSSRVENSFNLPKSVENNTTSGRTDSINSMLVGEKSTNDIPMTVPGAASRDMKSQFYSYPQRPDSRPLGPRDPPKHFKKKQEYI